MGDLNSWLKSEVELASTKSSDSILVFGYSVIPPRFFESNVLVVHLHLNKTVILPSLVSLIESQGAP